MHLHAPDAWLCSAVDSGGLDLDAIKPGEASTVRVRYALEALFLDGYAVRDDNDRPAAGHQLQLAPLSGEEKAMAGADTVVVKSGYFQLRRPPGLYKLTTRGTNEDARVGTQRPMAMTELVGPASLLEYRLSAAKPQIVSEDVSGGAYEGVGG